MAENTGASQPGHGPTPTPPALTPPADNRPRPRYGELAPEGWTWTPPRDAQSPAASADVPDSAVVPPGPAPRDTAVPAGTARIAPGWDRPLTLSLLILGLLGTCFAIAMLTSLPEAVQMLYTQAELGDYHPATAVAPLILVGSIGQAVVWLATAVLSVLLLIRSRRAFYLPLIGGAVAFVLLVATMAVVLAGDTALLDYFSRP